MRRVLERERERTCASGGFGFVAYASAESAPEKLGHSVPIIIGLPGSPLERALSFPFFFYLTLFFFFL